MRTRVVGTERIAEGQSGTIRWAIDAHGSALMLFKKKERNDIVREALVDGGNFYLAVFVPMNFTDYAKRKGYDVTAAYETRKRKLIERGVLQGPEQPLVYVGALREAALTRSTVTATATASKATIYLRIPIPPHGTGKKFGIAKIVGAVLKSIMPWEVKRVADVVEDSLLRALQGRIEQRFQTPAAPPVRKIVAGTPRKGPASGRARTNPGVN